jgi:uncharacterized protein involved in response to NO
VLYIMLLALIARVLLPQILSGAYLGWIHLAAICWLATFGILAVRYIPMLMQPRIDGREH